MRPEEFGEFDAERQPIAPRDAVVADEAHEILDPRLQRRLALGRVDAHALDLALPQHFRQGARLGGLGEEGVGAAAADDVVGVLAVGQEAEVEGEAGFQERQDAVHRPWAAETPALSPSKQITGSGASRQSRWMWSSVKAVPSAATTLRTPA